MLGFAGKPALPALLGRGNELAGSSGYWVGHSGESFAVELMWTGSRALPGSRGYTLAVMSDEWKKQLILFKYRTEHRAKTPGVFVSRP